MSIKGGVVQSGAVTPGDLTSWKAASVIQDAGTSAASAIAILASSARVLGNQGVSMVQAGNGSMANNGALTLTTGLGAAPVITSCYILLPAGAIATGVPAASTWYYALFSSVTAAQVFNNIYTTGTPVIPASPIAFATAGPGAYTGVSANTVAYQFSVPGNTLGISGGLRIDAGASYTNSAANKTFTISYGAMTAYQATATTSVSLSILAGFKNAGATGVQSGNTILSGGQSSSSALPSGTVDSTAAQTFSVAMQNATPASNNMVLNNTTVELIPGVL